MCSVLYFIPPLCAERVCPYIRAVLIDNVCLGFCCFFLWCVFLAVMTCTMVSFCVFLCKFCVVAGCDFLVAKLEIDYSTNK